MNVTLNRRSFLQFVTSSAVGVAASGITLRSISEWNAAVEAEMVSVPEGPETWAVATCSLCPGGCGLRVRKIGERAVKIQGNPLHPVNRGGLCPKGIAGLQALYHPDRLKAPQKNVGTRAKPQWKPISWDDALAVVTARLSELRTAGQGHTVVLIDRNNNSALSRLMRRFLLAYGSPNYLTVTPGTAALQAAVYLQQGITAPVAIDFERTRYLLNFGVNLLEGWGAPVAIMRAFGAWREAENGRRSKFVHIEPRMSVTASRADEWISLRPGTEAAFALGIAYVLITEGLYDQEFVRNRTFGFEDWRDENGTSHLGFRSLVLSEYRLNDVASMTGVPAETILRIAREFGRNRPALALGDRQTSTLPGSSYAAMAVHSLNALMGSIEVAGGALVQQELSTTAAEAEFSAKLREPGIVSPPEHPVPLAQFARLPEAIVSGKPYSVRMLLLHDVNPVFSQPNGEAFRQAFQRVPFIVSFASFLDESSAMADLVLPASLGLEGWQEAGSPPGFANAVFSLSPPAVKPRHDTRHPGDVVLTLARALKEPVSSAIPYSSFEQYLQHEVGNIFAAQSGLVFSPGLEENWARLLERSGWWPANYTSAEDLWKQMIERGGWWEPNYYYGEWERAVQTPSGRFEFYSQQLAQWAKQHPDAVRVAGVKLDDDRSFLPHQPQLPESDQAFPLVLLPFEVLPFAGGEGGHLPYLQQIAGVHLFEKWESWLEINPETARKLGIADGDPVWVESRRGRVQVRARLYAGTHPDSVHMPLGYGHTQGSTWACRGANPLDIITEQHDPLTGLAQTGSTAVRVYRA